MQNKGTGRENMQKEGKGRINEYKVNVNRRKSADKEKMWERECKQAEIT